MSHAKLDARGILITCPSCGKTNRMAFSAVDKPSRCGQCRTALSLPAEPLEAPDAAVFHALTTTATIPVVVDFWAPWCGPCRMMAPELDKVARDAGGRWLVVKVNTEAVPEVGEQFRIRSIPTLAVFADGREAARESGARPASQIEAFISRSVPANVSR